MFVYLLFIFLRSTYKQFVEEIIIEHCKGTKSGKDSKEFDVDHVRVMIQKVVKLESITPVFSVTYLVENSNHLLTGYVNG